MQDLIIYNNQKAIIQVNEKTYQDTRENFIADYGKTIEYDAIDYNRDTKGCWLNGKAFQKYPNGVCEDILNSIDVLLANKEKREYIAPTLYELKAQKLTELKTIRDNEEVKPIEYDAKLFDFDEKARDRINSAIIALDISGQSIEWTTADNTNVVVTANDLRNVVANVALRSNKLHEAYRVAKEKVNAATTKEEVDAIELEV